MLASKFKVLIHLGGQSILQLDSLPGCVLFAELMRFSFLRTSLSRLKTNACAGSSSGENKAINDS